MAIVSINVHSSGKNNLANLKSIKKKQCMQVQKLQKAPSNLARVKKNTENQSESVKQERGSIKVWHNHKAADRVSEAIKRDRKSGTLT